MVSVFLGNNIKVKIISLNGKSFKLKLYIITEYIIAVLSVHFELLIPGSHKLIEFDYISMRKTGNNNLEEQKSAQFEN